MTRQGRRGGLVTAVAGICTVAVPMLVLAWWAVRAGRLETGLVPALTVATVGTAFVAFTVWARSVYLIAVEERRSTRDWPGALTNPWLAGIYGLVAPGAAQVVAQRPGHAVLTLWSAGPFAASVALILQAPLIWAQRAGFARWGLDGVAVERILVVAAAATALAPLFWLAQTLEGARVLAAAGGRWHRVRGDWSALALASCLAAAVVLGEPQMLAANLSSYAENLAARDCVVAPVTLLRAARRLDPVEPAYALQLAAYHNARGDAAAAQRVRAELDRTLQAYVGELQREEQLARAAADHEAAARAQAAAAARAARAAMFLAPPDLAPALGNGRADSGTAQPPHHSRP